MLSQLPMNIIAHRNYEGKQESGKETANAGINHSPLTRKTLLREKGPLILGSNSGNHHRDLRGLSQLPPVFECVGLLSLVGRKLTQRKPLCPLFSEPALPSSLLQTSACSVDLSVMMGRFHMHLSTVRLLVPGVVLDAGTVRMKNL